MFNFSSFLYALAHRGWKRICRSPRTQVIEDCELPCVFGLKLGSSAQAENVLNCWPIFPALGIFKELWKQTKEWICWNNTAILKKSDYLGRYYGSAMPGNDLCKRRKPCSDCEEWQLLWINQIISVTTPAPIPQFMCLTLRPVTVLFLWVADSVSHIWSTANPILALYYSCLSFFHPPFPQSGKAQSHTGHSGLCL